MIYKNLFKDVDFEYSVTSSGVKEDIIVYNPLKYYEFYYTIYASDLNLVATTEGEIVCLSKNGRQCCISLLMESQGTAFAEILVCGASRVKINLNGATKSYFIIPVSYYSGGSRKLTINYNEYGDVDLTTYVIGAIIKHTYDYRELQSVELKDSPSSVATNITYGYTGKDLTSVTQSRNGVTQLAYQFSDSKTQAQMTVSGDLNASYTYNYDEETGWLTNRTLNLENSKMRTENFIFDGHGVLQSQGNIDYKTLYGYDSLDRLSTKTQVVGSIERQKLQYNYISTTEYQTNRISSIYNTTNSSRQTYSYNNRGYISSYSNTLNGDSYNYIYDGAGRLTSDGKYTYAYDKLNNITSKTSSGSTTEYGYWSGGKTRLQYISENGIKRYFSYDTMGNIRTYKGTSATSPQNLYWTRGNMLSSGNIQLGKSFSYQYGADNLRYSKTVNGEETLYYWDGDGLVGEKTGANYTQYLYDASGIIGMIYNGAYYYFEKNLFGDVLKAYNANGASVASFRYDSYGNVLSQSGSMYDKVHFRYRGYYYDDETSFYYLQSRYYDPSICRFISADQYELVETLGKSLGELNLYSYCANNPIMYTDESGMLLWSTVFIIIGVVAGAVVGGYIGYTIVANDPMLSTKQKLAAIGLCAILGGVAGGFFGAGLSCAIPGIIGSSAAGEAVLAGAAAISLEQAVAMGVVVGASVALVGGGPDISYSKSDPGMSNKPPVSWTTIDEGEKVYKMFNKDSAKASEYLLNNKRGLGNWRKGAKTEYNALKKWFDRIIKFRVGG